MSYVRYVSSEEQDPEWRRRTAKRRKKALRRAKREERSDRLWEFWDELRDWEQWRETGASVTMFVCLLFVRGPSFSNRIRSGTESLIRYQTTQDRTDLNRAIYVLSKAINSVRGSRRRRADAANNLAAALLDRSRLRSNLADLDEAIRVLDAAAHPRRGDTPAEARRLTNLIAVLKARTELETRTAPTGVELASATKLSVEELPDIDALRRRLAAMRSAPDQVRIDALRGLGHAQAEAAGPAAGHEDLAAAIGLLPRATGWGRSLGAHPQVLSDNTGLAADAAACALAAGDPVRAIELFETGRALQWDHLLHRSIRAELQAVQPRLAKKLDRAVAGLNRQGSLPADPRLAVLHRWAIVDRLADARLRPGYALSRRRWGRLAPRAQVALPDVTFQVHQYIRDIRPAADEGPVVAVTASRFGCYAMIVRSDRDEPQVVELAHLSHDSAQNRARRYLAALNEGTGPAREQEIFGTLHWLWRVIALPILDALDQPDGHDGPPRLWWCPAGALASLPLHAACAPARRKDQVDQADRTGQADSVLDQLVSSYTPTIRGLISARKARDMRQQTITQGENGSRRLLIVSVDNSPGRSPLPAGVRFRKQLTRLVPAESLTRLNGPSATCDSVTRALERHVWAHFDCHGVQHPHRPFDSGLALHDKTLTVSDLAIIRKSRPEYAFLAACTTALTHARMPDEMISLASALHYSGYQHVIGTLSSVLDSSTGRVSQSLYDQLAAGGQLWPAESARSLREAIRKERAKNRRHPSKWVPYVHVGV